MQPQLYADYMSQFRYLYTECTGHRTNIWRIYDRFLLGSRTLRAWL